MPYPTQPSITLNANSTTAFTATVTGASSGDTIRLFYRKLSDTLDTTGPTRVGNGTIAVTGLTANGQYLVYVVADDGSSYSRPYWASISLAITDSLTGAMIAKFDANPITVALITGGLWAGEVPETQEPPYAYIEQSVTTTNPVFEDELEFSRVTVQAFALGYQSCEKIVRQIKATFDYQELTFANFYGTVGIWPLTWRVYNEHRRWRNDEIIHRGVVTYRFGVHKSR